MRFIWTPEVLEGLLEHPSEDVQKWAISRILDLYPDLSERIIGLLPSVPARTASFILILLCDLRLSIVEPRPLLEMIRRFDRPDIKAASTALLLRSGHTGFGCDPEAVDLSAYAAVLADTESGFDYLLQLYRGAGEINRSVLYALSQACSLADILDAVADAEDDKEMSERFESFGKAWECDLSDVEGSFRHGEVRATLDRALKRPVSVDGARWKRALLSELEHDRMRLKSIRDIARVRAAPASEEQRFLLSCLLGLRRNEACQKRIVDAHNVAQLWAALIGKPWRGIPRHALGEFLLREQPEELLSSLDNALSKGYSHGAYPFRVLNSLDIPGRFDLFLKALGGKYNDAVSDEAKEALKQAGFPAARYIMQHHHQLSPSTQMAVLSILELFPTSEVVDFYITHFDEYMCRPDPIPIVFLDSLETIASSHFLVPLLREWREGERVLGCVIKLISEIHDTRSERIDRVIQDTERRSAHLKPLSPEIGSSFWKMSR